MPAKASPSNPLILTITGADPAIRDRPIAALLEGRTTPEVLALAAELEAFRGDSKNLYERVRASIFLHWIYRYRVQDAPDIGSGGIIPFGGFTDLMERRFEQAIAAFRSAIAGDGLNGSVASALAQAYERITYQDLADQVRRSVRSCRGNRWMFRVGGVDEHPIRLHPRLLERESDDGLFPILVERTPVRLDLSHSAWSDIFFLGMDYPEGARVLNISVDLGVHGRDDAPSPPIETRVRVIAEPVLRLTSDRPRRLQGRGDPGRAFQLRQRLPRPGQGGRDRLGPGPALARRDRRPICPTCSRRSSGRGWAWRSSARSTTSPRGRGWRSRRTSWRR